jgi:hypothetical protein
MVELHCWKSNVEHAAELWGKGGMHWRDALEHPATCMLPDGHSGPHQWTPDGEIEIAFGPESPDRNGTLPGLEALP